MIADQTSVFLAALAQAAGVKRYPSCIRILGIFENVFGIDWSEADDRIAATLGRIPA